MTQTPSGDYVLVLTRGEVLGLEALVREGEEGLLADSKAARGYIGGPSQIAAARRAAEVVHEAARAAHAMKTAAALLREEDRRGGGAS